MLCQNCNKRKATTHLKRIINAQESEVYLCSECASKMGCGNLFQGFEFSLGDIFSSLLNNTAVLSEGDIRCKKCGSSFNDIAQSGMAGCAECYRTFYDRLLPSLQRIHGKTAHSGKIGAIASENTKTEKRLDSLKKELSNAVEAQNFELAARLRDEIKELEKEDANNA